MVERWFADYGRHHCRRDGREPHRGPRRREADSSHEDLVQYNDGFKTGLIGTAEPVAERIVQYNSAAPT